MAPDRLAGPPALFLAPGTLGVLLVYVEPIDAAGHHVGVAVAETVLSHANGVGTLSDAYRLDTSFGPVTATLHFPGAGEDASAPNTFLLTTGSGRGPGLRVRFSNEDLGARRLTLRHRVIAAAALPFVIAGLLLTGWLVARRQAVRAPVAFVAWSAVAAGAVALAAAALMALGRLVAAPPDLIETTRDAAALAAVVLLPASWWWRRRPRHRRSPAPVAFLVEHALAGVFVAGLLLLVARFFLARINAGTLSDWEFPLLPIDVGGPLFVAGLLVVEAAVLWAAATGVAIVADRWILGARRPVRLAAAALLWMTPTVALVFVPSHLQPLPRAGLLVAAGAVALFGLGAAAVRRWYRHTTQAMRLVLLFCALLLPLVALYPATWFYANAAARGLIEHEYAPDTASLPQDTLAELTRAQREIDQIPEAQLAQLAAPTPSPDSSIPTLQAFDVWSRTSLATSRATSAIELYGANETLVSRFALNVPEYRGVTDLNMHSSATTCAWIVFGEAMPIGAEERDMLHAEREICTPDGRSHGAVIVHVIINDYRALPFIATGSPYSDALRSPDVAARAAPLSDLQVVVYGWSFSPVFTSANIAWPIPPDVFQRLYRSREPFWTTLDAEGKAYRVYFSNDQRFVYAIGYPAPTLFEHLTRVAEMATIAAILFVLMLLGAALYGPFARRPVPPLTALFDEIRTSFYRKLFLFFVLAAVGPVLVFALVFGAFMTARLRADVESEAVGTVTVARRVLEQSLRFQPQPDSLPTITDDVMVWIGQALHADVNLFEGPDLVATSQRDLFNSGLLPKRTPADVYRAIALERLPAFVGEDELGSLSYLVAAAPIPSNGHDAVLSVPLALRQREIEREINELNRGVLVGVVFVILLSAGFGASIAGRISDPVARLSKATRQIAAGRLDVRLVADTADELRRLIGDFNLMAATLSAQQAELARTNQLKAWAEMARQVAHEIKNPLTPIQLAAEHLQHVHDDQRRPLGPVFDECVTTILRQVRLLRQIASEFSNFAGDPTPRPAAVSPSALVEEIVGPYLTGLDDRTRIEIALPASLPEVWVDRTLVARALTNLVENALQAMPEGGRLQVTGGRGPEGVTLTFADTGVGMDADALGRAFEPYFSTKTAGSGLGLPNAKRNIERCGGTLAIESAPGHGTRVTVTLPLAAAAPAGAPTPSQ